MLPAMAFPDARVADRALEHALVWNLVTHAAAMAGMAVLLLPALPGGPAPDVARVARIAGHPWLFHAGWLPWHAAAVADLALAVALLRARWVQRLPAIAALVLVLAALVPDQGGQIFWETRGVALAVEATRTGDLAPYLVFEAPTFAAVAGWAGSLYTVAGIAWTFCLVRTPVWTPALGRLSIVTWTVFALVSPAPILPPWLRPPSFMIAAGNAAGFVLLLVWLAAVAEQVLRRARPDARSGVHAPWRYPERGPLGRAADLLAGSRLARALCVPLPVPAFASDITDVVYVSYLVRAERLAPLVPAGLELERLGPGGGFALFTFLTYRHGHFGPRRLGPLRRLFPSPVQTNWRIHVLDPRTGRRGVHFITSAITSTLQALGARLMSEGMPMHVLAHAEVTRDGDGAVHVTLDPGAGTAPDAEMTLHPTAAPSALLPPWGACFQSYRDFLAYCVPQDRAMDSQPWQGTVSRQEIDLGIPLDACEPLDGEVRSVAARVLAGDAAPLCFRVARVPFLFTGEAYDPLPAGAVPRS
jgi:hypothetical protein